MEEQWFDLKDYEGLYQISTYGNLRSLDKVIKYGNGTSYVLEGKNLKPYKGKHYFSIRLTKNGQGKTLLVHRLVALQFLEKEEIHIQVNHIDGNGYNNRLDNLEWCTRQENITHAWTIGLYKSGQGNGASKLTEKDVLQILELKKTGMNDTEISNFFTVSHDTISNIFRGGTWRQITNIPKRSKPHEKHPIRKP